MTLKEGKGENKFTPQRSDHHRGGPGGAIGMPVEKAKNFKGTLKRLIIYLKPHAFKLSIVFIFAIASTTFTIASPKIMGRAINNFKDAFVARNVIETVSSLQDAPIPGFPVLPDIDEITDPTVKADICTAVIDAISTTDIWKQYGMKLTNEQINDAINAVRETNGEIDYAYIGQIALMLLGMYLASAIFSLVMGLVMSGVAQKTVYRMRRDVDEKLNLMPLKFFDSRTHGEILSRMTNDIDNISGTLQQGLTQLLTSIVSIAGYIVMMLTISPLMTMVVLATLPLYIASTIFIAKKSQKYFAAQQKEMGILSSHVEEMYSGHSVVKAFGREEVSVRKFNDVNGRLYDAGWKAQYISGMMFPFMNFISNLGYVGISLIGGLWMTRGMMNLGDIVAFIQYSRSFTMPIIQTANIANILQSTIACAERVFELLDEAVETPEKEVPAVISDAKGRIEFRSVAFSYKPEEPLITGLDLTAEPGHTVAIVGPTGAGKTTLVNLLMRFYEIDGGAITFDGIDIRDLRRNDLRAMFGMVLQDTWLFNGTIRENIAYGCEGASEAEIIRAAKTAYADHFIRTLPDGYDTMLNEEAGNISQGQKQLLTIARAVLADPHVLILDEATSSVDTRTEVLIQRAMSNLMKDRTSFVIAHRLSTIREAESIIVMDHGRIIEKGNHRELLLKGGFYKELYNRRMGCGMAGKHTCIHCPILFFKEFLSLDKKLTYKVR